jgi:hypothetical protein
MRIESSLHDCAESVSSQESSDESPEYFDKADVHIEVVDSPGKRERL